MKRFLTNILLVLAVCAAASCEQEDVLEQNTDTTGITISDTELTIPAKGGSAYIVVKSEGALKVELDKTWCSYTVAGDTVKFSATENPSFESRYVGVKLTATGDPVSLTVQQFGYYTSGFEAGNITCSPAAQTYNFAYDYDDMMVATTDADWITLTVTEDNLKVEIAENTLPGTPENKSRDAVITWKLGYDSGEILVSQTNLSFMQPDSNWKVYYGGVKDYQGQDAAYIYNDVTDPTVSGKYAIYYSTKAAFTESGDEMNDFILQVAAACREELLYVIEYYASMGVNLTFSDFLYTDSDYEIFNPLDAGDYIAYAIGFDDEGELTGHYAYSEFTVSQSGGGGGDTPTGYDAWIGTWDVKNGTKTDKWTITAAQQGITYTITGVAGKDFPVEAEYYSDEDALVVCAQVDLGTANTTNYGEVNVGLYGSWGSGSFATPGASPYPIFVATLDGNEATLEPQYVSLSDGDYLIENLYFIGTASDGSYVGIARMPLPTTMTKQSSGGGGGGGEGGGTGAYNQWVGMWTVDSANGAFDFSLGQKVADQSYDMLGWQMYEDFFEPVEATFDNGNAVLYGDPNVPFATNVDIGAPEGACDLFYMGKVLMGGTEYYITSDSAYDVATMTLKSDGSAEITGNEVQLSDGGTYPFCRLEIFAIPISDPEGGAYTFNAKPSEFPLTATKSSSSTYAKTSVSASPVGDWVKVDTKSLKAKSVNTMPVMTPYTYSYVKPAQTSRKMRYIVK